VTATAAPTEAKPPKCTLQHCVGDCHSAEWCPAAESLARLARLEQAMADAWREHWPVGHPERLTDWRRTHLQPWRTVAEHLETVGVDW